MTPFTIYLWQQADSLDNPFIIFGVISTIAAVVTFAVQKALEVSLKDSLEGCSAYDSPHFKERFDKTHEMLSSAKKKWKQFTTFAVFCWLLVALIPSSKTIAMMVAIPAIANSEPIQKDLPELYQLAKDALKEQIVSGKKTETK